MKYVCFIIFILILIMGVSNFRLHLFESRLYETNVCFNKIKGEQSKWHNAHNQEYRSMIPYRPKRRHTDIESENENFVYYITAYNDNTNPINSYFVVQACITNEGALELGTEPNLSVWFVFPPEKVPDTEDWKKGWYDKEFFDDTFNMNETSIPKGLTDVKRYFCTEQL